MLSLAFLHFIRRLYCTNFSPSEHLTICAG
jgi:hypothetical protein